MLSYILFRITYAVTSLNKVAGNLVASLVNFSQVRLCLTAYTDSDVAPWMETASRGRVDGTRGFAGEQEYLPVTLSGVWYRDG